MICSFSDEVLAKPETIWKACFDHMKFELWDPDVTELKNVSGPCVDGTKFDFGMNSGSMVPAELSDVKRNECLTFTGKAFAGMLMFKGTIVLSSQNDDRTKIEYTFETTGFIGKLAGSLGKKRIIHGTEEGLANMIKLSKEKQESNS